MSALVRLPWRLLRWLVLPPNKDRKRAAQESGEVVFFFRNLLFWLAAIIVAYGLRSLIPVGEGGSPLSTESLLRALSVVASGIGIAAAAGIVGGFLGFLFGIPRKLQIADGKDSLGSNSASYGANTNLEQVSDWLTKILVGVGLVQITKLSELLGTLGDKVAPALGAYPESDVFGISISIFAAIDGFMIAYLWTRLNLGRALSEADELRIVRQSQKDADALELTERQLRDKIGVAQDDLNDAVDQASPSMRAHIYYKANNLQVRNWTIDPERMVRAIPVFRALIASDPDNQYHTNYGSLGTALKDKKVPNWAEALNTLNTAIEIRDERGEQGFRDYEFNRAECLISMGMQDGMPKEVYDEKISKDLIVGHKDPDTKVWIENSDIIQAWILANHFSFPDEG
ncbi:MAG: hypothetical protein HQ495_05840 [Alphaproteobacteria bacterium]|nr:hypothetical protein [Alphaproteobacteria bacterium]